MEGALPESPTSLTKRPASPDILPGSDRKRRRKVLSCLDCRRRKLQCDRAMPACGRCTKSGSSATCLYVEEGETDTSNLSSISRVSLDAQLGQPIQQTVAASIPTVALSRLEHQERRIQQLEAALLQTGHVQASNPVQRLVAPRLPPTPDSVVHATDANGGAVTDRETMALRGRSFKTRFCGNTHTGAVAAHIPELNRFTKEAFERFPALARLRQDMHALEDRAGYAVLKSRPTTGEELKALLPPKAEVDELVDLYITNYGSIYHILHMPSFRKEYKDLWISVANARPHFVAIVMLMMAAAQCLISAQPRLYTANSSTAREKAITYIQCCDEWLQAQSQKQVDAAAFQIRFLMLFARQVTARKYKRSWTDSGTLVRFCMAAGLHRNPDLLWKKTSALDKELRRRIWAATVELELQAAFDRGMIPAPWPMQTDCPPPGIFHDDDLDQDMEWLPSAAPKSDFTTSSYLALASESILLRHGLSTTLNSIRQTLSFEDTKRFTEQIESLLQRIPDWSTDMADIPRALLSLNLRQYLLVLHDRQLRQASTITERSFSRMILVDTATKIIQTHRQLISKGTYALELLCSDQLRAALSICHVSTTLDVRAEGLVADVILHHANHVMEEAVQMLTDKVTRFGRGQLNLWTGVAAYGFWKAWRDPSQHAAYLQEAVDAITGSCAKILAGREEVSAVAAPDVAQESAPGVLPGTSENALLAPQQGAGAVADYGDPLLFDMDDIDAWTFDNWAFDPLELQQAFPAPFHPPAPL